MILRHAPRYPESMVRLRGIYPIHPAELLPKSVENPAETAPKKNSRNDAETGILFTGAKMTSTTGSVSKNHYVELRGEVRRSRTF